jgi:3-phosphoshikimate 1-carboxyvinyltransferase
MTVRISPAKIDIDSSLSRDFSPIELSVPPDKSILHRLLLIGSLTKSAFRIPIESPRSISHDVIATMLAVESLGVPVEFSDAAIEMNGVGRRGFRMPTHSINCANSGTTARLLMGLLSGQQFESTLTGDASLVTRPMKRVADVLAKMGTSITTTNRGTLPVTISGRELNGAEIVLSVPSAQMKSAVLLAALFANGDTTIRGMIESRDHTERMLSAFGFGIDVGEEIVIHPEVTGDIDEEIEYKVPGDLSCAAFLFAAAILLRKRITVKNVGLNPSRTRFLDMLALMGVECEASNVVDEWNEPRGDVTIYGDRITEVLEPFNIGKDDVSLLIDELPILMALSIFANGESVIRGAGELRLKESDRISLVVKQFRAFGVEVEELEDGMIVQGVPDRRLSSAPIIHGGDHRLAMAFSIAGLFCESEITIEEAESVAISYPDFYSDLEKICGQKLIVIS